MTTLRRLDERGLTLPEVLIALLVFSAIMAGVLGVLRRENKMMWRATERMNALQNVRYAADIMEQEFRTAGAVTLGKYHRGHHSGLCHPAVRATDRPYRAGNACRSADGGWLPDDQPSRY